MLRLAHVSELKSTRQTGPRSLCNRGPDAGRNKGNRLRGAAVHLHHKFCRRAPPPRGGEAPGLLFLPRLYCAGKSPEKSGLNRLQLCTALYLYTLVRRPPPPFFRLTCFARAALWEDWEAEAAAEGRGTHHCASSSTRSTPTAKTVGLSGDPHAKSDGTLGRPDPIKSISVDDGRVPFGFYDRATR